MFDRQALLQVCRRHAADPPAEVVVPEPYLPLVPDPRNGILVLAEAQNLSGEAYVLWLKNLTPEGRMTRLPGPHGVGVGPWDDGPVRLALKAVIPSVKLAQVALGNAVPWSRLSESGANANPSEELEERATRFWRELLAIWQPQITALIVLGNVAKNVMANAGCRDTLALRLPSPNSINRVQSMFDKADLLDRYPEVRHAMAALQLKDVDHGWVLFACHAVSLGKRRLENLHGPV
ncbi:MAG: hypothetical protein HYZ53_27275 [Planctomycetes bacterium]|nr:hypothetical protein [Planctomycetota bacterium]